jgi:hypothetical protein
MTVDGRRPLRLTVDGLFDEKPCELWFAGLFVFYQENPLGFFCHSEWSEESG